MSKNSLSRRQALALLAVVVLAWGFTWVVSKLLLQYMTPLWAVAARSAVGAAALLLLGLALRRVAWPVRANIPVILSVGLLHMGAFAALVSLGLQHVPAGRSVVLAYTTPLWVIPAARLFLGEPIGPGRRAGLLLGLAGLILIFNPLAFDWSDRAAIFGNALVLLAALCWAANIVYVRAHRWVTPPFELAFWQALLATVVLSAAAWATEGAPRGARTWRGCSATAGCSALPWRTGRRSTSIAPWPASRPSACWACPCSACCARRRCWASPGRRAAGRHGADRGDRAGGARTRRLTAGKVEVYLSIYIFRYI